MCIDRAGINHRDGITHNGVFDVAFLSGLPNVRIYTPATFEALERALCEAMMSPHPTAIRYPAGDESEIVKDEFYMDVPNSHIVKGRNLPDDAEIIIVSHGRIAEEAVKAGEILRSSGVSAGAILLERLTPYAETADGLWKLISQYKSLRKLVFLEEEIRAGGMGMMLSDELRRRGRAEKIELSVIGLASTAVTSVKADGRAISFSLENGKISFGTLTVVNELSIT